METFLPKILMILINNQNNLLKRLKKEKVKRKKLKGKNMIKMLLEIVMMKTSNKMTIMIYKNLEDKSKL